MARHHQRREDRNASLNMVSLMDIFTILVFFLLVSAANTEVLPTPKRLTLPESTAQKAPKENIVIMVNNQSVLLQGRPVARLVDLRRQRDNVIPNLLVELRREVAAKKRQSRGKFDPKKQGVTIMADKQIPYALLKKIMLTCAAADLTNISLAVTQKTPQEGSAG